MNIFEKEILDMILKKIPDSGNFLDAGLGSGSFLRDLSNRAFETGRNIKFFGFDKEQSSIDFATTKLTEFFKGEFQDKFHFQAADLRNPEQIATTFPGVKFDYINLVDVLFFLTKDKQKQSLESLKSLLKEEGQIRIIVFEPRPGEKPFNDRIKEPINASELKDLLENLEFKNISINTTEKEFPYGKDGTRYHKIISVAQNSKALTAVHNPSAQKAASAASEDLTKPPSL